MPDRGSPVPAIRRDATSTSRDTYVELVDVCKGFGGAAVLRAFSLSIARREFITLLGPSGCGKTTLLRLIAGLIRPDSGAIRVGGRDLTAMAAHKRNVGIVFQSYALFPHLNVWENVAFGLRARRAEGAAIAREVDAALDMVRLGGMGRRSARSLSGGQQQRVALARAIVTKPAVMLLDEPFSALDRKLRESMQIETRELLRRIEATAIFVTHDQEEALVMSDRVVVMKDGHVEQIGTPQTVYRNPATPFVLDFVGQSLRLAGRVETAERDSMTIATAHGIVRASGAAAAGSRVLVAVRPECVELAAPSSDHNAATATVRDVVFVGSSTHVLFEAEHGDVLAAELGGPNPPSIVPGARATIRWRIADTLVFPLGDG
jgi:putative spermidine/putrescine transport system ATP-binding protein